MNIEDLSALEIGRLVNKKLVSPVEVVERFIKVIEACNPKLNAFVYTKFEDALYEAKELESKLHFMNAGPLAGVPIGLKDFLPSKKGWPASHGGVRSFQTIDDENSVFYDTCARLGAIAIGKTNAPSFGFRGTTDNKMYGPTSTPFNTEYNSGGSSGGSASAVGAGLVPLAEGGDAGGSIRIPSAWCGCFGFKPSAGLIPSVCRPDAWTATHPYCCGGPISRNVEDSALVISEMQGYDPRDPLSVPLPKKDLSSKRFNKYNLQGMRIGFTYNFNLFPDPDDEIASAMEEVANILSFQSDAEIRKATFGFKHDLETYENAWLEGIAIDTMIDLYLQKNRTGFDLIRDFNEDLSPEFISWHNPELMKSINLLDYREFHEIRTEILDAHLKVFNNYDIILAPVCGCLPVKNKANGQTMGPSSINGHEVDPSIGFAYTYLENMIGTPAASVPIGLSNNGLPIAIQVIGRRYEDEKVFDVAYALQKYNPWNHMYKQISLLDE